MHINSSMKLQCQISYVSILTSHSLEAIIILNCNDKHNERSKMGVGKQLNQTTNSKLVFNSYIIFFSLSFIDHHSLTHHIKSTYIYEI